MHSPIAIPKESVKRFDHSVPQQRFNGCTMSDGHRMLIFGGGVGRDAVARFESVSFCNRAWKRRCSLFKWWSFLASRLALPAKVSLYSTVNRIRPDEIDMLVRSRFEFR